jgi:hypothetical protein
MTVECVMQVQAKRNDVWAGAVCCWHALLPLCVAFAGNVQTSHTGRCVAGQHCAAQVFLLQSLVSGRPCLYASRAAAGMQCLHSPNTASLASAPNSPSKQASPPPPSSP